MADNFNRLIRVENHVHMFALEAPFLLQRRLFCCQLCAAVWWLCVWLPYMSKLPRPRLLSRERPSTCSLHPPAVAALWDTETHRAPDWATLAWPSSISATTLITSQMVIDEASLAALHPLKDSQTYIRRAMMGLSSFLQRLDFTGNSGAWFANYSWSSTPLPRADRSALITSTT